MDTPSSTRDPHQPLPRVPLSNGNEACHMVAARDLILDPPCQRGSVWGPERQRELWYSLLRGIPTGGIIISRRADNTEAVIDGKQRIEAVRALLNGTLDLPASWFGLGERMLTFDELDETSQHRAHRPQFAVGTVDNISLEQEQELFELVNFSGVPQGESDTDSPDNG